MKEKIEEEIQRKRVIPFIYFYRCIDKQRYFSKEITIWILSPTIISIFYTLKFQLLD